MLDEAKSLLQKALRRKDALYVKYACHELLLSDQLSWRSILIWLCEDHCLVNSEFLMRFNRMYALKNKYACVMLLFQAYTCRIAAHLPIISMQSSYDPIIWRDDMEIPESLQGLVEEKAGSVKVDLLLAHIVDAWKREDTHDLFTYIKLASITCDNEQRVLTEKGKRYLHAVGRSQHPISALHVNDNEQPVLTEKRKTVGRCKPHIGALYVNVLYRHSTGHLKQYIYNWLQLASGSNAPMRLILFTILAYRLHYREARQLYTIELITSEEYPGPLNDMPSWATDIHTYRGRTGRDVPRDKLDRHPNVARGYPYYMLHAELYYRRPKQDREDFWATGLKCNKPALDINPYWDETLRQYRAEKPHNQKTVKMTLKYITHLKNQFSHIFHSPNKRAFTFDDDDDSVSKRQKLETDKYSHLPLFQQPTSSSKVHTRLDIDNQRVIKGPYVKRRELALFYHECMLDVLGDKHTLPITDDPPYLIFPLLQNPLSTVQLTHQNYNDKILKSDVEQQAFVKRESLGYVQVHKIKPEYLLSLSTSVWVHFLLRYGLNVGDSGLYNMLTNVQTNVDHTTFGIDMEETRGNVHHDGDIISYMFSKRPAADACTRIRTSVRLGKHTIIQELSNSLGKTAMLTDTAKKYNVTFDCNMFTTRISRMIELLSSLQ